MTSLLLLALLGLYHPDNWQVFPSLDEVRCISSTGSEVYVAVPRGICVFDRRPYRLTRTLTVADGISGDVRLCAHNPARGDVFITTDAPSDGGHRGHRIYHFIPATGRVEELSAPFKWVSSIGIAKDGAYFETDAGAFFRARNAAGFAPAAEFPPGLIWYGSRDTLDARDFPFLTPYFVMDEQLVNHRIALVRPDRNNKRLFVAADGYGILVYGIRSGFSEAHIRFGPSRASVSRIAPLDDRLWFIGGQTAVALDADEDWHYFLTRPGDLSTGNFRLLLGNVTNLARDQGLSALLADSAGLLLGTGSGIYSLGSNNKLARILGLPVRVNGLLRINDSLLFGTEEGLFLSVGDSVVEYNDPYGETDWGVFDIVKADNGTAFFGAHGGIVSRTRDGAWFRYVPPGSDLRQPVRALAAAGTRVFMATGSSITVLDTEDDSYAVIDAARGLPASEITSLYADDQYLWIASPGLIARLDYNKELK